MSRTIGGISSNGLGRRARRFFGAMAVIVMATTGVFLACDNGTDSDNNREPITGPNLDDVLNQILENTSPNGRPINTDGLSTTVGGEQTYIGYAIKAFGGPTFGDALGAQLFDNATYAAVDKNKMNPYISSSNMAISESHIVIKEDLSEVYCSTSFAAKVGTGKGVPWFSGSVESQYGSSKTVKSESKYYQYVLSRVKSKQGLIGSAAFDFKSLLAPGVLDVINGTAAPEAVFNKWGTHVMTGISIGGEASITALYNSSSSATETDMKVALEFKSTYVEGSGSTSKTEKQKQIANETSILVKSNGGDALLTGATLADLGERVDKWVPTIEKNPTIANIYDLTPIWELADDPARAKEFEDWFNNKCEMQNSFLADWFKREGDIIDGAAYEFENWLAVTRYLTVDNFSKNNMAELVTCEKQTSSAAVDGRKWKAIRSNAYPGYFNFRNVNSNRNMDVRNSDVKNVMWQFDANASDAQLFKVLYNTTKDSHGDDVKDGSISFIPKVNNAYKVSIRDTTIAGCGDRVILSNGSGNATKWKVYPAD